MVFEKKYFVTKREFKNWAWRDYNVFKEVFKSSPSKRKKILEALEKYWPSNLGSLTKNKLLQIEKKIKRDLYYGETLEKKKIAKDLSKLIESFKKHFPS